MRNVKPKCYGHCGKRARKGFVFCSLKCAANWAEELALGNEDAFFLDSGEWEGVDPYGDENYDKRPRITMSDWVDLDKD